MSKIRAKSAEKCVYRCIVMHFRILKVSSLCPKLDEFGSFGFLAARDAREKSGRQCSGKKKESRESTQKAVYAKYVVMVHLSQSVKLFLNFHDLYFYI